MRQRKSNGSAMMYSLSEFAYLLLFIAIAACGLIYNEYLRGTERIDELQGEVETLTKEVNFLNEMLAEKEHAVVPCWRRPEGTIPKLVGTVTIHNRGMLTVSRSSSGRSATLQVDETTIAARVSTVLRNMFADDLAHAEKKNCYLRMNIVNKTNNFELYKRVGAVVRKTGIVLVQE